jgi:SOS-response transcriptional repressor LexA
VPRHARVTGIITPGAPIAATNERVDLPPDRIASRELVLRLAQDLPDMGLAAGDLLIIEPRSHAATGELVIALLHDRAFIGRWWTKHRTRQLMDGAFHTISDSSDLVVLGAVTLIARSETR